MTDEELSELLRQESDRVERKAALSGERVKNEVAPRLHVIPGSLALSSAEDALARAWPSCLDGDDRAFRITTAFWRCIQLAAEEVSADVALVDLGPNLSAINRAALVTSDDIVVPVAPDLYSTQGLRTFGPALREWRQRWDTQVVGRRDGRPTIPTRSVPPAGYVVLQSVVRLDRPAKALDRWLAQIPSEYASDVLGESAQADTPMPIRAAWAWSSRTAASCRCRET